MKEIRQRNTTFDKYRDRLINDKLKDAYDSIVCQVVSTKEKVGEKRFKNNLVAKLNAIYRFGLYNGKK